MTYRVTSPQRAAWTVTAPGGRTWSGAPSQRAAFDLATSLAGIDTMLTRARFAHYRQRYLHATKAR